MTFVLALRNIFESGIQTFNEAQFDDLSNYISPDVEFIAPAVIRPLAKKPAVHLNSLVEVIQFWTHLNSHPRNHITRFEYLEIGKVSIVRCYYDKIGLVMDTEITFDNFGIVTKILQHLVEE